MEKKTRNILIGVVIICLIGGALTFDSWDDWLAGSGLFPDDEPTELTESTFVVYDAVSGEVISSHIHLSIHTLKDTVTNPTSDDIRTLTNFEEKEATKDAEVISIDLREIPYFYIEFNPAGDQYWANTYQLEYGMENKVHKLVAHHQASNVTGTVLDSSTMNEWDKTSDIANGVIVLDVPRASTLEQHYGDGWETTTAEYNKLSTTEQNKFKDQRRYRDEFPTYSPLIDLDKDGSDELEIVTNVLAIEFTFNVSVSLVDGATTQVNLTVQGNPPIILAYSATKIFMLFYSAINFENGPYSVSFSIALSTHVKASTVKTVRVPAPYETSNLGTPVGLSTFPL